MGGIFLGKLKMLLFPALMGLDFIRAEVLTELNFIEVDRIFEINRFVNFTKSNLFRERLVVTFWIRTEHFSYSD